MNTFKINDPVRDRYDRVRMGEVIDIIDEYRVRVKWKDTMPEDEDIYDIELIDAESNKRLLEEIQGWINESVSAFDMAFTAFKEAKRLVGDDDTYTIKYADLDLSKLEGVINSNGWSTSSLYC